MGVELHGTSRRLVDYWSALLLLESGRLTAHRSFTVLSKLSFILKRMHLLVPVQYMMRVVQGGGKVVLVLRVLISQTENKLVPTFATLLLFAGDVRMARPTRKPVFCGKGMRLPPRDRGAVP